MLDLLLTLAGFLPLIYGANLLVDGASAFAARLKIPSLVIGLTIVAFGTSAPELVVNIFSSATHTAGITLGNVLGSNIFNIGLILGITAIIQTLNVKSTTTWKEIPLTLIASILIFVLIQDQLIDKGPSSQISRIDGIVLLLFFIIFLSYTASLMQSGNSDEAVEVKPWSAPKAILIALSGLVLLVIGGKVIVTFASGFARNLGISERIIGLTIVSIGTSLPELATSVSAALKKNVDIAIGNITGSNIFNSFLILGVSSVIWPVQLSPGAGIDLLVNIGLSLLLFLFVFTGKGRRIEMWEGIVFVSVYGIYLFYLIRMG
jgi:cation:H+ antiporter